jgi:hypothetical protein
MKWILTIVKVIIRIKRWLLFVNTVELKRNDSHALEECIAVFAVFYYSSVFILFPLGILLF